MWRIKNLTDFQFMKISKVFLIIINITKDTLLQVVISYLANIVVPPSGILADASENTPGHIIPTDKPDNPY